MIFCCCNCNCVWMRVRCVWTSVSVVLDGHDFAIWSFQAKISCRHRGRRVIFPSFAAYYCDSVRFFNLFLSWKRDKFRECGTETERKMQKCALWNVCNSNGMVFALFQQPNKHDCCLLSFCADIYIFSYSLKPSVGPKQLTTWRSIAVERFVVDSFFFSCSFHLISTGFCAQLTHSFVRSKQTIRNTNLTHQCVLSGNWRSCHLPCRYYARQW